MDEAKIGAYAASIRGIAESIERVFVGKEGIVTLLLNGVIASLHVLIEDVPGVGKTTLAKALSHSLGLDFVRIQFTPDLLPGDIVGMTVWRQDSQEFVFKPGTIMHQFILADEINRASPRTQSSLLEAMQEQSVTVDGRTYQLPDPFVVVATQNPSNFAGAFQLPEGELDRFGIAFSIGYPNELDEREILSRFQISNPLPETTAVISPAELREIRDAVREIHVANPIRDFIVDLVKQTRSNPMIQLGASPRASVQLQTAAQGHAFMQGRAYVTPEDVMALCAPVLSHRVILSPEARMGARGAAAVIQDIVKESKVPVGFS